jgi:hypothetical protein
MTCCISGSTAHTGAFDPEVADDLHPPDPVGHGAATPCPAARSPRAVAVEFTWSCDGRCLNRIRPDPRRIVSDSTTALAALPESSWFQRSARRVVPGCLDLVVHGQKLCFQCEFLPLAHIHLLLLP